MDVTNLDDLIGELRRSKTRLEPKVLRAILLQLLEQVEAAHARHIVHGYIDPSFVRVERLGEEVRVVLEGFERAAAAVAHDDPERPFVDLRQMTFAAPESFSWSAGRMADLYSVGVIACVLVVGVNPYLRLIQPGDGSERGLLRVVEAKVAADHDPVAGLDLSGWPSAMASFLRTATAHDPLRRYRDAAAFRLGLERAFEVV